MVDNKMTLNFIIEKGEPIRYYFSARIKLTDESRDLLRAKLGNSIQLNSLDNYFNLSPENFYIYDNKYSGHNGRSELYVRGDNGSYLASNLPLNHYGFSVELLPDGSSIADYGFYHLYDNYNKAQEKVKMFGDSDLLFTTSEKVLNKLLSNTDGLTTQEIFSRLQSEDAAKEVALAREKRHAEEELSRKNEELKELVEKGEINLFKVIKGQDIGNGHSAVILQSNNGEKSIILDSKKFYIAEYEGSEFLHCTNSDYDTLLGHDDLFFVLNKISYPNLESGFYSISDNSYASYLNAENHYLSDNHLSEKLSNSQEENNNQVDTEATQPVNEEIAVQSENKPKSEHRISKRELREEDAEEYQEESITTYQPSQELMQNLFPNKEQVVINDKLTSTMFFKIF